MTTTVRRPAWRLRACAIVAAATASVALATASAEAAGEPRSAATIVKARAVKGATSKVRRPVPPTATPARELSYSDEFERAELIDRMLTECRGVSYNAYELAQTSGEALWMPAPIQLMVVRVRHPYCAELLRTYASKEHV